MALDYAIDDPGRWLTLAPHKLTGLLALEGREVAYLYSNGYFGAHPGGVVLSWALATLASFPLLLLSAVAGLTSGQSARSIGVAVVVLLAVTLVMHLATFGDPRFHLPLVPVLALAASQTRLDRARGPWAALVVCTLLAPAWYAQAVNYMPFVRLLMAPGGWQRSVSFDDLL